jgi:hypothetical protein
MPFVQTSALAYRYSDLKKRSERHPNAEKMTGMSDAHHHLCDNDHHVVIMRITIVITRDWRRDACRLHASSICP